MHAITIWVSVKLLVYIDSKSLSHGKQKKNSWFTACVCGVKARGAPRNKAQNVSARKHQNRRGVHQYGHRCREVKKRPTLVSQPAAPPPIEAILASKVENRGERLLGQKRAPIPRRRQTPVDAASPVVPTPVEPALSDTKK